MPRSWVQDRLGQGRPQRGKGLNRHNRITPSSGTVPVLLGKSSREKLFVTLAGEKRHACIEGQCLGILFPCPQDGFIRGGIYILPNTFVRSRMGERQGKGRTCQRQEDKAQDYCPEVSFCVQAHSFHKICLSAWLRMLREKTLKRSKKPRHFISHQISLSSKNHCLKNTLKIFF